MDPANRQSFVQEAKRNNNLVFVTWSLPWNAGEKLSPYKSYNLAHLQGALFPTNVDEHQS